MPGLIMLETKRPFMSEEILFPEISLDSVRPLFIKKARGELPLSLAFRRPDPLN
jgi:hypothetical protein